MKDRNRLKLSSVYNIKMDNKIFTRTLRPRTATTYNNDRNYLPRDSEIPYLTSPAKTPEQEA